MNDTPLVSVILLCHNQVSYVQEAFDSVMSQTYPRVELIVVDDGSTDGSKEKIQELIGDKNIAYIDLSKPVGNCTAFNKGYRQSKGSYIIDLAADDLLLPNRIANSLPSFTDSNVGVSFCDVLHISPPGKPLATHFVRDENNKLLDSVPTGNVYKDLIQTYFICPPGMVIKREVLDELNGYDETLSYEDFDFWIRSSRNWAYVFENSLLVHKRKVPHSLSARQFERKTHHQRSTLEVCKKIKALNLTSDENTALRYRVLYEIKQCIQQRNWHLIPRFLRLLV